MTLIQSIMLWRFILQHFSEKIGQILEWRKINNKKSHLILNKKHLNGNPSGIASMLFFNGVKLLIPMAVKCEMSPKLCL